MGPIVDLVNMAGLQEDCPYVDPLSGETVRLDSDMIEGLDVEGFGEYVGVLYAYLQELENRVYSEGKGGIGIGISYGIKLYCMA